MDSSAQLFDCLLETARRMTLCKAGWEKRQTSVSPVHCPNLLGELKMFSPQIEENTSNSAKRLGEMVLERWQVRITCAAAFIVQRKAVDFPKRPYSQPL